MRPRIDSGKAEGRMQYNQRTARKLESWLATYKVKPLHLRVLTALYKAAWDEKITPFSSGINHLQLARSRRSRLWWEGLRDEQATKRRRVGLTRTRSGPQAYWEDLLVDQLGLDWRQRREKITGKSDWMRGLNQFLHGICTKFRLPYGHLVPRGQDLCLPSSEVSGDETAKQRRLNEDNDGLPSVQFLLEDLQWSTHGPRIKYIVDCQPLCEVLNGDAVCDCKLDGGVTRPILAEAAAHFDALLSSGWRPQRSSDNFVHWRKREHNKLADYICNRTMDEARDWQWQSPELLATLAGTGRKGINCRLLGFSDGGRHENRGGAAAAWILVDSL